MQNWHQAHIIWLKFLHFRNVCSSFQVSLFGFEDIYIFFLSATGGPVAVTGLALFSIQAKLLCQYISQVCSWIVGKMWLLTTDSHNYEHSWHHNGLSFIHNKVSWCWFWLIQNSLAPRTFFGTVWTMRGHVFCSPIYYVCARCCNCKFILLL